MSQSPRGAAESTTGGIHAVNQVPRAVPPHRRYPSLATTKRRPLRRARSWQQGWHSRICRSTGGGKGDHIHFTRQTPVFCNWPHVWA